MKNRRAGALWLVHVAFAAVLSAVLLKLHAVEEELAVLETLNGKVETVAAQVTEQSSLLGRAVGEVIPLRLPSHIDAQFSKMEGRLLQKAEWPKDQTEARDLMNELGNLIDDLPPWIQEELLPRLIPLRWGLETLYLLTLTTQDDQETDVSWEQLDAQYAERPFGAHPEIVEQLASLTEKSRRSAEERTRAQAIEFAKRAISDGEDLELAIARLSDYNDTEALDVRAQVQREIMVRSVLADIAVLEGSIEKYQSISELDLREYGLSRLRQELLDTKLRLTFWGEKEASISAKLAGVEAELKGLYKEIESSRRQRYADSAQNYQIWALEQIKAIPELEDQQKRELEKIRDSVARNNPLSDAREKALAEAQRVIADQMIQRMGTIDRRFLDEAVAQWFGKVYQRQLLQLSEDQQLRVVHGFAIATKKPMEDAP